jgi:hypothetical protein
MLHLALWRCDSLQLKIKLFCNILNLSRLHYIKQCFSLLIRKIKKNKFPEGINIETISFCNSSCIVCPAVELKKELAQGKMPMELYKKIIDECCRYQVSSIFPYFINEPLLDENLIERLKYTKEKMPLASIYLSTNASLLTPDKVPYLLKYVDIFIFSVFGNTKERYEKMMPGLNFEKTLNNISYFIKYKKDKGIRKVSFIREVISSDCILKKNSLKELRKIYNFWKDNGILWSYYLFAKRAGDARNSPYIYQHKKILKGCWNEDIPLRYIYIMFNGDAVLCCMDCRKEVILGNVTKQSVYEIWNSKLYNEVRDKIYSIKNKKNQDDFLCNRCLDPRFNILV